MKNKNESELGNQVDSLIRELESSGNAQDNELARKMQLNQKKFEKSLADLQESLDYLRICIKYQVFDLEATRRENAYLRKLLNRRGDEDEEIIS